MSRFPWAAGLALLALAACAPKEAPPDRLTLAPATFAELPGWTADRIAEVVPAFTRSCAKIRTLPPDRALGIAGTAGNWAEPCAALAALPSGDDAAARAFFERWFTPFAAANNDIRRGLFTGYYEVELKGSRTPSPAYPAPLYKRPADLVMVDLGEFSETWKGQRIAGRVLDGRLKPFEDRTAIEAGALRGKGLEILWVDDPIGAFFLQIQGSGRVTLADGQQVRVGYAGQNGRKYVAIGKELIERGELTREEVSLQTIRAWLQAHPAEAAALMNKNPSYVFFQELTGDGPLGADNLALTAGRSLAVDRSFLPLGLPIWLDAEDPLDAGARVRRLLVAQDTGGAIRGPVRGDVFWGYGPEAELRAGKMKSAGEYWLLIPKSVTPAS